MAWNGLSMVSGDNNLRLERGNDLTSLVVWSRRLERRFTLPLNHFTLSPSLLDETVRDNSPRLGLYIRRDRCRDFSQRIKVQGCYDFTSPIELLPKILLFVCLLVRLSVCVL